MEASLPKKKLSLRSKRIIVLTSFFVALIILMIASTFIGPAKIGFVDGLKALFGNGSKSYVNIMQKIRLPHVLGAVLIGVALSISGVIMQTVSNNVMASPTTLGVSNSAVLGANIAIIILGGGVIAANGGNVIVSNPCFVSVIAFIFALGSTLLVLGLARINKFNAATTVLIGVIFGMFATGVTTLIQYFASDTQLASAVYWSFGSLERISNYKEVLILFVVVAVSLVFFMVFSYRYNALLLGEDTAATLGINLNVFRFVSLLLASLLTAVVVSLVGIIGFIGLVIPQVCRKLVGNDHKFLLPTSALLGAIMLLICDLLARTVLDGFALPVGAITAIIGAPIFIVILLVGRGKKNG